MQFTALTRVLTIGMPASALLLLGASVSLAQLSVYEPWDYTNQSLTQGADIVGVTGQGSVGFAAESTGWGFESVGTATYDTAGLSYLGPNFNSLVTAGGAATITPPEVNTKFIRALENPLVRPGAGEPNQDFWLSFLLRLDSSDTGDPGDAFWSTDGLWDKGAVGVQSSPNIRFINGGTSDVTAAEGETHLIVTRIIRRPLGDVINPTSDSGLLYVDPALDIEPAPGDANATFSGDTATNERIRDAVNALFKFNAQNNGVYTLDEFRIGSSYADVTPFVPTDLKSIALFTLPSSGDGVTDRTSSDTEPLTLVGSITGGSDPAGTEGGISLPGDDFNEVSIDDAFANGDFLEFTIGLDQATSMSLKTLNIDIDLESAESVFDYALRTSLDGFSANTLPAGDFDGLSPGSATLAFDLESVAGLQDVTTDVTFRIAFANALADIGSGNGALVTNVQAIGSVEGVAAGLEGDFNDDGVVNLADYTVWRDNLGSPDESALNGNGDGGGVTASDYDYWKARFGNTSNPGAAAIAGTVPEPSSLLILAAIAGMSLAVKRRAA